MTIINPGTSKGLRPFILLLICIMIAGGSAYIREYNSFVDVRNELKKLKTSLVALQEANADLKNKLYLATEPKKLERVARERGLLIERRPEYLLSGKWLSDSSR